MVFISNKKISKVIALKISEESTPPQKTGLYRAWKKVATPVSVATIVLYAVYLLGFRAETAELVDFLSRLIFHVETPNKLLHLAAILITYFVFSFLYIIIHELIHLVFCIDGKRASVYIVLALPVTVSAHYDAWITKKKELLSLIAPTVIISALLIPLFWIWSPFCVGLMLLYHLLSCSSDIFAFFYLIKALPADCVVYGHYYKSKSTSGYE